MVHLGDVGSSDVNAEVDMPAALCDKLVGFAVQLPRNKRKEVARLRKGVNPDGKVSATVQVPTRRQVSVAQKHRVEQLVGLDTAGELGHDVGAVEEVCDASEAFGLALGAKHAVGRIKSLQESVVLGTDAHDDAHLPVLCRRKSSGRDGHSVLSDGVVAAGNFTSVDEEADQLKVFAAVEIQAIGWYACGFVAGRPHHGVGNNGGATFTDNEIKVERRHMDRHRLVVQPVFGLR